MSWRVGIRLCRWSFYTAVCASRGTWVRSNRQRTPYRESRGGSVLFNLWILLHRPNHIYKWLIAAQERSSLFLLPSLSSSPCGHMLSGPHRSRKESHALCYWYYTSNEYTHTDRERERERTTCSPSNCLSHNVTALCFNRSACKSLSISEQRTQRSVEKPRLHLIGMWLRLEEAHFDRLLGHKMSHTEWWHPWCKTIIRKFFRDLNCV